jgi:hypothetical protein
MMVGLRGVWRLHWGPIRKDLVYDFLKGFKNVDEMEIKVIVHKQKVKITNEMIYEMMWLLGKGPDTELLNPLQKGVTKMCKRLVDETVVPREEGWSIIKMNGWYV